MIDEARKVGGDVREALVGRRVSVDVRLTLAPLQSAIQKRRPPPGCVHHTDRGSQYDAGRYRQLLAQHGFVGSMERRGNPYDNAKAESFMKTPKVEAVYSVERSDLRMSVGFRGSEIPGGIVLATVT